MKKIIFGLAIMLCSFTSITGIYDLSVTKIEGGSQSLSICAGKKLLVITLPVAQDAVADSSLYALDTLATAHEAELTVLAVPSYEDGYTPSQKEALKLWYRSKLNNSIIIIEGLYTRKTSGSQQHPLFKWLTDSGQNEVFDIDVAGPGYKFFINRTGELYGVLQPQNKISGSAVQKTLALQQ